VLPKKHTYTQKQSPTGHAFKNYSRVNTTLTVNVTLARTAIKRGQINF